MAYLKEHEDHERYIYSIVHVSSSLGSIEIEACDFCDAMNVFCEHIHNTWLAGGTALICDLCGSDGA